MEIKRKEYTFKKDNGEEVYFDFYYTYFTYYVLLSSFNIDLDHISSLQEAEKARTLMILRQVLGAVLLFAWVLVTGFLAYNLFTCVEVVDAIKYLCGLLFWVWFTCVRR